MFDLNSREIMVCYKALVYQRDMLKTLQNKEFKETRRLEIEQLERTIKSVFQHIYMFFEKAA